MALALAALTLALACAVNFFWQTGFARALEPAALLTGAILIFWLSGLWDGASRHSWGVLWPVFLLFLALAWGGLRLACRLVRRMRGR